MHSKMSCIDATFISATGSNLQKRVVGGVHGYSCRKVPFHLELDAWLSPTNGFLYWVMQDWHVCHVVCWEELLCQCRYDVGLIWCMEPCSGSLYNKYFSSVRQVVLNWGATALGMPPVPFRSAMGWALLLEPAKIVLCARCTARPERAVACVHVPASIEVIC